MPWPKGKPQPRPDTFDSFVAKRANGCWEWQGHRSIKGYGLYRERRAHRVAYERRHGSIPPGMLVCHSCDNPRCVNADHLWLGTHSDNILDRTRKGRGRGNNDDSHPSRKLSSQDVSEIRQLKGVVKQADLAARFQVNERTIRQAQSGRAWK